MPAAPEVPGAVLRANRAELLSEGHKNAENSVFIGESALLSGAWSLFKTVYAVVLGFAARIKSWDAVCSMNGNNV
jgi:hypothetical protein